MADDDTTFIFVAVYGDEADAQADYDVVKELYHAKAIGNFDAAVIRKAADGKVHVNKDETATRKGAWGGAAVGAVVGILFPPSLLASAGVGALAGGLGGHFLKGMSRSDVKDAVLRSKGLNTIDDIDAEPLLQLQPHHELVVIVEL
ncbi:MAG: hypothetical protein ACPGN4_07065, partial [Miltoncostaeaceae bacterium]